MRASGSERAASARTHAGRHGVALRRAPGIAQRRARARQNTCSSSFATGGDALARSDENSRRRRARKGDLCGNAPVPAKRPWQRTRRCHRAHSGSARSPRRPAPIHLPPHACVRECACVHARCARARTTSAGIVKPLHASCMRECARARARAWACVRARRARATHQRRHREAATRLRQEARNADQRRDRRCERKPPPPAPSQPSCCGAAAAQHGLERLLKAILMSRSLSRHGGQFVDKRLRSEKLDRRTSGVRKNVQHRVFGVATAPIVGGMARAVHDPRRVDHAA